MSEYIIRFPDEDGFLESILHSGDDTQDWNLDPEAAVTSDRNKAAVLPYDIATFIADIFDGEVEEK